MGRLIDADVLKKDLTRFYDGEVVARRLIDEQPTVDAVPVVHGRWIYHVDDLFPGESTQECDQCHEEQPLTCDDNFCPHCGAKMNGKDGDNNE